MSTLITKSTYYINDICLGYWDWLRERACQLYKVIPIVYHPQNYLAKTTMAYATYVRLQPNNKY